MDSLAGVVPIAVGSMVKECRIPTQSMMDSALKNKIWEALHLGFKELYLTDSDIEITGNTNPTSTLIFVARRRGVASTVEMVWDPKQGKAVLFWRSWVYGFSITAHTGWTKTVIDFEDYEDIPELIVQAFEGL